MIDEVIQEAETTRAHRMNTYQQLQKDAHRLQDNIKRVYLELQGWEAYIKTLKEQRARDRR